MTAMEKYLRTPPPPLHQAHAFNLEPGKDLVYELAYMPDGYRLIFGREDQYGRYGGCGRTEDL